jgi:hypothetical protein
VVSETQIANKALLLINVAPVSSLDEQSQAARALSLAFAPTRDALLREFPWNFAARCAALTEVAGESRPGWLHVYQYPGDCLFARRLFSGAALGKVERERFEIVSSDGVRSTCGLRVLADLPEAWLEYTARIEDVTKFDALFVELLATRLAADLAYSLIGQERVAEYCYRKAELLARRAGTVAASEGVREVTQSRRYVEVR